jgi:hypothetical protein
MVQWVGGCCAVPEKIFTHRQSFSVMSAYGTGTERGRQDKNSSWLGVLGFCFWPRAPCSAPPMMCHGRMDDAANNNNRSKTIAKRRTRGYSFEKPRIKPGERLLLFWWHIAVVSVLSTPANVLSSVVGQPSMSLEMKWNFFVFCDYENEAST